MTVRLEWVPAPAGTHAQKRTIAALRQDEAAELFRQTVLPHLADGLALARWLAGNQPDAEDILQEACERALKAIGGFRGGSGRAWLLAIVRNTAFTWLARHRSQTLVMVGDLDDIDEATRQGGGVQADPSPSPEVELIRRADIRTAEEAIAALSLPLREVVVLRDVNGLTYREIAELVGLPLGTVMSRLARARQQLALLIRRSDP